MESQDRELIQKYIEGNCTEAERRKVALLLADPAYQSLFEEVLGEQGNPLVASHREADERMMQRTERIRQRILRQKNRGTQQKKVWRLRPSFYKYAAVWIGALAVIAGMGYFAFWGNPAGQLAYTEKQNKGTAPLHLMLADSSVVVLGPGSKLRYPETFAAGSREVSLQGEAFFEIHENKDKPFLVSSGDVRTQVLGTSFKVTAFSGRPTSVAVATGKVRVDHMAGDTPEELALLTPGQQVLYADGKAVRSEVTIAQVEGWQDGQLIYRDTPLGHITDDLERWYGIQVRYQKAGRADMHLDVNLRAGTPLESSLRLLAGTGGFTYTINGKIVTIN